MLQCWEGRVRIWHKQHENMDSSCLILTVQVDGGIVVHSWHTFGSFVSTEHHLNTTDGFLTLSLPLWPHCSHVLMAASTTSQILNHLHVLEHDIAMTLYPMASTVPRSQSNRTSFGCVEQEIPVMDEICGIYESNWVSKWVTPPLIPPTAECGLLCLLIGENIDFLYGNTKSVNLKPVKWKPLFGDMKKEKTQ